jgi:hypothetical protein
MRCYLPWSAKISRVRAFTARRCAKGQPTSRAFFLTCAIDRERATEARNWEAPIFTSALSFSESSCVHSRLPWRMQDQLRHRAYVPMATFDDSRKTRDGDALNASLRGELPRMAGWPAMVQVSPFKEKADRLELSATNLLFSSGLSHRRRGLRATD